MKPTKKDPTFPHDYSRQIAVVDALRKAFETVKHHQAWSRRLLPAFQKALPGYTLSLGAGEYGGALNTLRVWGNGLTYDEGVYFSFHASKPWAEAFAWDLDRKDSRDSAEREADEVKLLPELDRIESEIAALRVKAKGLIEALPVPKSAKVRAEPHFWNRPSSALEARYPEIFGARR